MNRGESRKRFTGALSCFPGRMLIGIALILLLSKPLNSRAAIYYVATNGVDTNAGTSTNAPWRTIQQAANSLQPGDSVLVRGGIYNEMVTVKCSGSAAGGAVTFQNYPGETPVVDGTGLTIPQLAYAAGLFEFTNASYVIVQGF